MGGDAASGLHTLVLGGARSGKSAHALKLAEERAGTPAKGPNRLFIATAAVRDEEMEQRVQAHREERGPAWHTVEEEIHLAKALSENLDQFEVAVIDCLGMWVTNLLLNDHVDMEGEIQALETLLKTCQTPVILVSNEVGMGIVPENRLARRFRDVLGSVNQRFALLSSTVIFMAAGIPLVLKDIQP